MGRKALPTGHLCTALGVVIRRNLGDLTQHQLADLLGVSEDTMTRWLNGERAMSVDNLGQIGAALKVLPSDLMRETQDYLLGEALADASTATVTPIRARRQPSTADSPGERRAARKAKKGMLDGDGGNGDH